MSKYHILMNKSPTVPKPYAIGMLEIDDSIYDKYKEYISDRRDKYDPYAFIEWLMSRYNIKFYKPDSVMFNRHADAAVQFNFSKPNGRANKTKTRKAGKHGKRRKIKL